MTQPFQLLPPNRQHLPQDCFLAPEPVSSPPSPRIKCPKADYRSWTTWPEVGQTMRYAPAVHLRQSWRAKPEEGFTPGTAAVAHAQNELIIYAELSDDDIFNPIRENGIHAYRCGDVFEIFLRAADEENYFEHHITPNNCTLQLCFPSSSVFRRIKKSEDSDWARDFAGTTPVSSHVLVQTDQALWRILAIIPLNAIFSNPAREIPAEWRFSLCRYDYIIGKESPILSSTSAYRKPDFHDLDAWGTLTLVEESLPQDLS